MSLKLWNTEINGLFLGNTEINKAYLGSTLIYDNTTLPHELLNDLVSYYKLDWNANDAHWSNDWAISGASYTSSWKINWGYDLDWVNDYLTIPTDLVDNDLYWASAITLSAWHQRFQVDEQTAIINIKTDANNAWCDINFNANNTFRVAWRSITSDSYQQRSTSWTYWATNTWYHIVWILDFANDKIICYIDWVEVINSTVSFWSSTLNYNSNYINIWWAPNWGWYYTNWVIDEYWCWSRALTQTEVTALYNSWAWLSYNNFTS